MPDPSRSHAAFRELLDTLGQAAGHGTRPDAVDPTRDAIEGLRAVLHLLSAGIDFYLEGDPERPDFVRMVSPTRKFMGDNPDAIYHFARIRDDRAYRVSGRRGDECYLSLTIHGRADDGRLGATAEPVLADVNDRGLQVGADGRFEIELGRERRPGNWIELPKGAASIIARHYFEGEGCPAADPDTRIELRIESVDPAGPRAPLSDGDLARRLADVTAFVRGATLEGIDPSTPIPFVSRTPNELPEPMVFRMAGQDSWGAVDIAYAMAPFRIEPDQALVMEGRFPECAFANVVLWNPHMQCFEYRDRRVSLNRAQTRLEGDGSYRIAIAHRDPGVPNWLDTEGHREGTIFWRILLPEGRPARTACRLVPLASLAP